MKNLEDLLKTDFSGDNKRKEAIKARLLGTLEHREHENHAGKKSFRKKSRLKLYVAVAAAVFTVAACSVFYGEDIARIVRQFTVGRYAIFQVSDSSEDVYSNQVRDATSMTYIGEGVYITITNTTGDNFSYDFVIERERYMSIYFDTIDYAKPYLAFTPRVPDFLPEGFTLDRISLFGYDSLLILTGSDMYLNVFYTNDEKTQQIYLQIRLMNELSAFATGGSSEMRYVSINGNVGVIDHNNLYVEIDGVMYMFLADMAPDVTQEDLIKMAESLNY